MAVSICYNFLRIKNWKKVSDNGSNAATPPWAVPAAFYAPDGCSRAISRPGRFFFRHCTHIGNSAAGAIAASPQTDAAKPHPLGGFILGAKVSPYILFCFRVWYCDLLKAGLSRHRFPWDSLPIARSRDGPRWCGGGRGANVHPAPKLPNGGHRGVPKTGAGVSLRGVRPALRRRLHNCRCGPAV